MPSTQISRYLVHLNPSLAPQHPGEAEATVFEFRESRGSEIRRQESDALLRYFYFFWWTTEHGVRKVERCMAKLAHARHTHITMTLLGRSAGTACWLSDVVARFNSDPAATYSRQLHVALIFFSPISFSPFSTPCLQSAVI